MSYIFISTIKLLYFITVEDHIPEPVWRVDQAVRRSHSLLLVINCLMNSFVVRMVICPYRQLFGNPFSSFGFFNSVGFFRNTSTCFHLKDFSRTSSSGLGVPGLTQVPIVKSFYLSLHCLLSIMKYDCFALSLQMLRSSCLFFCSSCFFSFCFCFHFYCLSSSNIIFSIFNIKQDAFMWIFKLYFYILNSLI